MTRRASLPPNRIPPSRQVPHQARQGPRHTPQQSPRRAQHGATRGRHRLTEGGRWKLWGSARPAAWPTARPDCVHRRKMPHRASTHATRPLLPAGRLQEFRDNRSCSAGCRVRCWSRYRTIREPRRRSPMKPAAPPKASNTGPADRGRPPGPQPLTLDRRRHAQKLETRSVAGRHRECAANQARTSRRRRRRMPAALTITFSLFPRPAA